MFRETTAIVQVCSPLDVPPSPPPPTSRLRFCAGESLFRLHYKNKSQVPLSMSLTPIFPAKVVPVDLTRYNGLTIQKMSYFATTGNDLKFTTFTPSTIGGCIGGVCWGMCGCCGGGELADADGGG